MLASADAATWLSLTVTSSQCDIPEVEETSCESKEEQEASGAETLEAGEEGGRREEEVRSRATAVADEKVLHE